MIENFEESARANDDFGFGRAFSTFTTFAAGMLKDAEFFNHGRQREMIDDVFTMRVTVPVDYVITIHAESVKRALEIAAEKHLPELVTVGTNKANWQPEGLANSLATEHEPIRMDVCCKRVTGWDGMLKE